MSYIGNQPTSVAFLTDQFSGTGSQTAFTLSAAPANTASILVAVSGVLQDPTTYSTSGLTLTFSAAPPSGTGNISVRYLGIPASNITTTAYRTLTEFTATAGQTTFTVPSYTAGFINVYRNGARLGAADYTATNGTTVVLATGATSGDLVTTESFFVSSVLNAIPATAGAVSQAYLGSIYQTNAPAFSVYEVATQNFSSSTWTKINFDTKEYDTANCFSSGRFTPNVAGYYQINATADCDAGSFANNLIRGVLQVYKNGASYRCGGTAWNLANGNRELSLNVSSTVYLNGTTDYVEIYIYAIASSTIATGGGGAYTWMNGSLLRGA